MDAKHSNAYYAVSKTLLRYERKEKTNVVSILNKNCKNPCNQEPTSISSETINDIFKDHGISFMSGLGNVGIVIINIEHAPYKHKPSKDSKDNGLWVYYEFDTHNNKYNLHVNWRDTALVVNAKQLDTMTSGVVINNIAIEETDYHTNISKDHIKDIKDVFNYHLNGLVFDKALIEKLILFRLAWSQKDDIYIEFLGSNLLGVHPIRFSENDENNILVGILRADKNVLKTDIFNLEGINKAWKVTSNMMSLTLLYLMHGFIKSDLSKELKEEALRECYYIFAYKIMGSLIAHYFKWNADPALAKAVYERLSNRFLIKRFGTWQLVFEHRALDILPKGIHYDRLNSFTTDDSTRALADLQGRLREIVKYIYTVLKEVELSNEKIYSTSSLEEDEEGEQVKDITSRPDVYVSYLRTVFNNEHDFLNDDLIHLITSINPKLDVDNFVSTLKYMSNKLQPKMGDKDDVLEHTINITINYLRTKNIVNNYHVNAYNILILMKGYWSSSSVKDPIVRHMKDYTYHVAQKATGKKTSWMLASISISVLMYIFLRAIYRNK
jgi:hypothetical protein